MVKLFEAKCSEAIKCYNYCSCSRPADEAESWLAVTAGLTPSTPKQWKSDVLTLSAK